MEDRMCDIINNSSNLSSDDKELFKSVFKVMSDEQQVLFDNILRSVNKQINKPKSIDLNWNIVTALIDKADIDKAKENHFNEIIQLSEFKPDNENEVFLLNKSDVKIENGICSISGRDSLKGHVSGGIAFLNCAYGEINNILNKKYEARITIGGSEREISYKLKKYDGYYFWERLVQNTALQYDISRPIIFSPFSRRAAEAEIDLGNVEINKNDEFKIDYMLSENGLDDILIFDKTLVWNIDIINENELPLPKENTNKEIVSKFDKLYSIYEFAADDNEYIYVESDDLQIERYDNVVYVNIDADLKNKNIRYCKIRVNNPVSITKNCFYNFFNADRCGIKQRINTKADIAYVLSLFDDENIKYLDSSLNENSGKALRLYGGKDNYYYNTNRLYGKNTICYLKFEEKESILFEDYISYVIAYMRYYYPEFWWVGVV